MSMDRNIGIIDWKQIIVTGLISAPISAFIMIIFSKTFEQVSVGKLVAFFIVFLVLIFVIFMLFQIPKMIRSRRLQIRILPQNKISIPVNGRELAIIIYNKNKFDIDCKIRILFPNFLKIFQTSNFEPFLDTDYNRIDYSLVDSENERIELQDKIFEEEIKIVSMDEYRITLKLMPTEYGRNGYITYRIESPLKIIDGKIIVNT